jgi:HEAT repeat protein
MTVAGTGADGRGGNSDETGRADREKPMRKAWVAALLVGVVVLWFGFGAIWGRLRQPTAQERALQDLDKRFEAGRISGRDGTAIVDLAIDPNPPTDTLIQAVTCPNRSLRGDAAKALGLMAERRAVGALIAAMNGEHDDSDRWYAWALGSIGDPQAVGPMIQLLQQSTRNIMSAGPALKASPPATNQSFAESLMSARGVPVGFAEVSIIEALGRLGDARAVEPLIARLVACQYDAYGNPRLACEASLGQLGLPAVPALVAALKTADPATGQSILTILGAIGDERAAKPIIDCLNQPRAPGPEGFENRFRDTGLLALAQIGSPEALEYLSAAPVKYDWQEELPRSYAAELVRHSPDSLGAMLNVVKCYGSVPNEDISRELARLKDPQAIPVLVGALDSGRNEALVAIGAPAIGALTDYLKARPGYASWPISVLGKIDDPSARTPLWEYIRAHPKDRDRGEALLALAHLKDKTVIPVAREWLSARPMDSAVASCVILALAALGDTDSIPQIAEVARTPLGEGLEKYQAQNLNGARVAALRALVDLKAPDAGAIALKVAAEPLKMTYLSDSDRGSNGVLTAAIHALVALKAKDSAPVLLKIASNPIPNDYLAGAVYLAAVDALGQLGDASCAPTLLKVLGQATATPANDVVRHIAIAAADALIAVGAKDTAQPVAKLLVRWGQETNGYEAIKDRLPDGSTKDFGTVGGALCRVIAASGDPQAFDLLVAALQGESYSVRPDAVLALGNLGDKRALAPLAAVLEGKGAKDPGSNLPRPIADAMFKLDPDQAVAPLLTWLRPPKMAYSETYVVREFGRRKVSQAAGVLGDKLKSLMFNFSYSTEATYPYQYDYITVSMKAHPQWMTYDVPLAYARCAGSEAVPLLILALRTPCNWHMQTGAAEGLGEIRDRRAVAPLIVALGEKAWPVREAAAVALGQIGDPAALPALAAAGQHGDIRVRKAAQAAVEAIQNPTPISSSSPASQASDNDAP